MSAPLTITFHGGAGTVTGANFLLESENTRILIDCGLTQGEHACDACNFDDFEYDPETIDALIITHAHLDHIGRAPKLIKDGFTGEVHMTPPTLSLAEVMLADSEQILREEAKREQKPPMYESDHIAGLFAQTHTHEYHQKFSIGEFEIYFMDAGHILGSAITHITHVPSGEVIVFSGDLGNAPSPLLPNIEKVTDANYLVMESVYGDRLHEDKSLRGEHLKKIINESVDRGGALLIPAFSIERTQILLYELSNMLEAGEIPEVPVFLDSPLAIKVTEIYKQYSDYFKETVEKEVMREGDIFAFPFLHNTRSREASKDIRNIDNPKIIIAGAGMSHGGRIQHHELHHLEDPQSTLLIVGYQSPGSLGRRLQDGAKSVKIYNRTVQVRARIETITGFSAHADRDQLVEFASHAAPTLRTAFMAMGEPSSSMFLAQRLHDFEGIHAVVPEKGKTYPLT